MAPTPLQPRVLVCDDELGPRVSIEFILKAECDLVVTDGPAVALSKARQGTFEAAIIDWSMGDPISAPLEQRAGGALLRALLEIDRTLSVIVFSAHSAASAFGKQALAAGAFAYLSKPSSPQELGKTVRAAVAETRRKRSIA